VCHALLDLASALELKITTEDIETPEEAHWLFAQGV
jgi:EAL domain-containing protein (putative c-di-GMP-specific phosphodiesterase class I)